MLCRSGHPDTRYLAGAPAPDGRTGTVAKFAGSSPVRLSRNAMMSRVSISFKVTPSCTRAMTFTASALCEDAARSEGWSPGTYAVVLKSKLKSER